MYKSEVATKKMYGYVHLSIENTPSNAVELAAAWGLYSRRRFRETYWIKGDDITFRFKRSTFKEWLEIVKSVTEDK